MIRKKERQNRRKKAALGFFFVVIVLLLSLGMPTLPMRMSAFLTGAPAEGALSEGAPAEGALLETMPAPAGGIAFLTGAEKAYAIEGDTEASGQRTDENGEAVQGAQEDGNRDTGNDGSENSENANADANAEQNNGENDEEDGEEDEEQTTSPENSCQNSLGVIGWLICPVTGKLAEATDWLYDRIEQFLIVNPVEMKDGEPIYEVWKYCLGLTNIVFAIFLLVVIYSQLTGVGISNYGIKRALPKLIVMAVMVNLSFLICSVAVDLSNILGAGIRDLFQSIEKSAMQTSEMQMHLGMGEIFEMLGGAGIAVGSGVIALELGAVWMLIPAVFGALVAVLIGLMTIAMRQAVIALLVMISPLAMTCMILPNTEQWYRKWKQLFFQMLVFYPMFSTLFGASALAGFVIIYSAKDGFGLILGAAVQIVPLVFAVPMMKMSGTFLETINSKLHAKMVGPQQRMASWADERRQLTKARHLAGKPTTPSLRLMQFMSKRKVARNEELEQHQQTIKNRGLAHRASQNYRRDGTPSRRGERTYAEKAENLQYQREILRDQNNMERGLEPLVTRTMEAGVTPTRRQSRQLVRVRRLDERITNEADYLRAEQARGDQIGYENAVGFNERMDRMMNAHMDAVNGFERTVDEDGNEVMTPKPGYVRHSGVQDSDLARYNAINQIMDGSADDTQSVAATAAMMYDARRKIREVKFNKYFDQVAPTRDVVARLTEMTTARNAVENIDAIMAGMRVLNQRGDKDLLKEQIDNVIENHDLELGTHASQALGNFLMFEVKDGDPFLRRLGKYINLETAMVYSTGRRTQRRLSVDEMVTGQYEQIDPQTGETVIGNSKMALPELMSGTSLDGMERKALDNLEDMLKHAYTHDGRLDVEAYLKRRREVEKSMGPAFIAASQKFLSGSDEIKAQTKFLTGYDNKGKARWEAGGDLEEFADTAEQYFREQTIGFIKAQTPKGVLAFRSDFYSPLMKHLSKQYEMEDAEELSDEEREEREEMWAEMAAIQTRYGDRPPEEANQLRAEDLEKLRDKMAGAEFRHILDKSGKLEQIYRTRRSGAANNAKDWVREWLGLNDEAAINERLHEMQRRRARKRRRTPTPDSTDEEPEPEFGGFDETDRQGFAEQAQAIYDDWAYLDGADVDAFYEESCEFVRNTLGDVGDYILQQYEEYRTARPEASAQDLLAELRDLLLERDNY